MKSHFITSSIEEPFKKIRDFLNTAKREIIIIVPFIRSDMLHLTLPNNIGLNVTIITSWKIKDLWAGASDINLYPYVKENSFQQFINNRIHLKVYMTDWQNCIFGSSNLSKSGLGLTGNYNYELNSIPQSIDLNTLLYLKRILSDSILMNDNIYEEYCRKVNNLPPLPKVPEVVLDKATSDTDFLISSLPMSRDINILYTLYANEFLTDDEETKECAVHDMVLYNIPFGLTNEDFMSHLKDQFFNSPFTSKLLKYIDEEERYFGQVKAWIQSNCKNVPIPSRRDLTGNIQVLYKWIIQLSEGSYLVDTPNYSERIYRVKQ